jgi:hypothetical protein
MGIMRFLLTHFKNVVEPCHVLASFSTCFIILFQSCKFKVKVVTSYIWKLLGMRNEATPDSVLNCFGDEKWSNPWIRPNRHPAGRTFHPSHHPSIFRLLLALPMSPRGCIDGSWPASQQQATSEVRVMFFEIYLAERERDLKGSLAGGSILGSIWRDCCCHISHMMRELWLDCESFQFPCLAEEEEEETAAAAVATERYSNREICVLLGARPSSLLLLQRHRAIHFRLQLRIDPIKGTDTEAAGGADHTTHNLGN